MEVGFGGPTHPSKRFQRCHGALRLIAHLLQPTSGLGTSSRLVRSATSECFERVTYFCRKIDDFYSCVRWNQASFKFTSERLCNTEFHDG